MKFSAAALALAATVAAKYPAAGNGTVYTTEVYTALTTYCPEPTTLTHGSKTYTVTAPTTLTITDCPCTVSKPVYVTSSVVCHKCNDTTPTTYKPAPPPPAPTGGYTPTQSYPPTVTAGAGKVAALSGAGLAAAMGLAALL